MKSPKLLYMVAAVAVLSLVCMSAFADDPRNHQPSTQNVNVVNKPTLKAEQSGTWNVDVDGTVDVNVMGTPTVALDGPVEIGPPHKAFFAALTFDPSDTGMKGVGYGSSGETMVVSSLVITNFNTTPQQVRFTGVLASMEACSGTLDAVVTRPRTTVILEPFKTLQLTFPVPLKYSPYQGQTCMGIEVTSLHASDVLVLVSGAVY